MHGRKTSDENTSTRGHNRLEWYSRLEPKAALLHAAIIKTFYSNTAIRQFPDIAKKIQLIYKINKTLSLGILNEDIRTIQVKLEELQCLGETDRNAHFTMIKKNLAKLAIRKKAVKSDRLDPDDFKIKLIQAIMAKGSRQPVNATDICDTSVDQHEFKSGGRYTTCDDDFSTLLDSYLKLAGYTHTDRKEALNIIEELRADITKDQLEKELTDLYSTTGNLFIKNINRHIGLACIFSCIYQVLNTDNYNQYEQTVKSSLQELLNTNNSTCPGDPQSTCHTEELKNWLLPWVRFYFFKECSTAELTKGVLSYIEVYMPVMLAYIYTSLNLSGALLSIWLVKKALQYITDPDIKFEGDLTALETATSLDEASQITKNFSTKISLLLQKKGKNNFQLHATEGPSPLCKLPKLPSICSNLMSWLGDYLTILSNVSTCIIPLGSVIIGTYTWIAILESINKEQVCHGLVDTLQSIDCETTQQFSSLKIKLASTPNKHFDASNLFSPFNPGNLTKTICFEQITNNSTAIKKDINKILKIFNRNGIHIKFNRTLQNIIASTELCMKFETEFMLESLALYYATAANTEIYCYYLFLNFIAASFTTSACIALLLQVCNLDYRKNLLYSCMKKIGDTCLKSLELIKILGSSLFVLYFFSPAFANRKKIFNGQYSKDQLWQYFKQFLVNNIKHAAPVPQTFVTLSMLAFFQMQIYLPDGLTTLITVSTAATLLLIMQLFCKSFELQPYIQKMFSALKKTQTKITKLLKTSYNFRELVAATLIMLTLTDYCNIFSIITNGEINTSLKSFYNSLPNSDQHLGPQPYHPSNHTPAPSTASHWLHQTHSNTTCQSYLEQNKAERFVALNYFMFILLLPIKISVLFSSCIFSCCALSHREKNSDSVTTATNSGPSNYQELQDEENNVTEGRNIPAVFGQLGEKLSLREPGQQQLLTA